MNANSILKRVKYAMFNLIDFFANLINIGMDINQNEILIVHLSSQLGDFLMLIPTLHLVRKQYPDKIINLVMHKRHSGTRCEVNTDDIPWAGFLPSGIVDKIFVLPSIKPNDMVALRRIYKDQLHPYLIYNIGTREDTFRHQILVDLWMRFMGFKGKIIGNAQTDDLNWKEPIHYRSHVLAKLASVLSDEVFLPIKMLQVDTTYNDEYIDYQFSDEILKDIKSDSLLVAIVPGSRMIHKRWPIERFVSVIRKILNSYPESIIVLSGVREDKELGNFIKKQCHSSKRIVDIIDRTNVAQLAAIFQKMDVVITVDGGSMHLADMMGAAVIGLCPGILPPQSIEPWHNYVYSIRKPMDCSPCFSYQSCPLGTSDCLLNITDEEVMHKFQTIYDRIQEKNIDWTKERVFKIIRNENIINFEEVQELRNENSHSTTK